MYRHLHRKLLMRLFMFTCISTLMLLLVGYHVYTQHISFLLASGGLVLGEAIGLLVGNLSTIEWQEESSKIIARFDRISVLTLLCYLVFTFSKKWVFGHWIHGDMLSAFTYAILFGVMTGRLFYMRRKVLRILNDRGL
ncbi:hypothetical protein TH61_13465 [Rufibacter sp. DG15C]|uniref:hypothetical protein n=1 Tax=Rufibacter sp. DG15C TaxID=1379909 RepID=UPI00078C95D6|nr:hypothetical protein [Rufibacter sp. DG15C]AMM51987.1 hypothetical protein TH61_13465 [Rufibacter sp. DG15C]